jgi:hypothetical protein
MVGSTLSGSTGIVFIDVGPLRGSSSLSQILPFLFLGISPTVLPLRHISFILRFGNNPTPEMRWERVPKVVPLLVNFCSIFGPKMVPKLVRELAETVIFWGTLLDRFLKALELFWCLLAAFLGLPRRSWKASDPKNIEKRSFF